MARSGPNDITLFIGPHVFNKVHRLNAARAEGTRAAQSAKLAGGWLCYLGALLIGLGTRFLDARARTWDDRGIVGPQEIPYMRFVLFLPLLFLALLFPAVMVYAQGASLPVDLPADVALQEFLQSLGGFKGASALGIALLVVQAVMYFFRTSLASFAGKWRLAIVAGLSLVAGTMALFASGVPWQMALMHANTLGAFNVFLNQMFKQFVQKADEAPTPPSS